jgi:hypothetical protein
MRCVARAAAARSASADDDCRDRDNIKEIAAMIRIDARILAAALATIALSAHAANAEGYKIHIVPPCATCNTFPGPGLPDLLGPQPTFGAPDHRPAEPARLRPSAPGAPSAHRPR